MTANSVDATNHQRIAALGEQVLGGGRITRDEALFLFNLEASADILDLLSWSNRIREKYRATRSISARSSTPRRVRVRRIAVSARSRPIIDGFAKVWFCRSRAGASRRRGSRTKPVTAVGLVAAWKGLNEGPLRMRFVIASANSKPVAKRDPMFPSASSRTNASPTASGKLGVECYGHNLESSRRFFPQTCSTHTFDDRLQTIGYLKRPASKFVPAVSLAWARPAKTVANSHFTLKEIWGRMWSQSTS